MLTNSVSEAYPVGLEATVSLCPPHMALPWSVGTEGRGGGLVSPHSMLWLGMGIIPPTSTTWRTLWSSIQWPLTMQ